MSNPFKNLLGDEEDQSISEEVCESCPKLTYQQVFCDVANCEILI